MKLTWSHCQLYQEPLGQGALHRVVELNRSLDDRSPRRRKTGERTVEGHARISEIPESGAGEKRCGARSWSLSRRE